MVSEKLQSFVKKVVVSWFTLTYSMIFTFWRKGERKETEPRRSEFFQKMKVATSDIPVELRYTQIYAYVCVCVCVAVISIEKNPILENIAYIAIIFSPTSSLLYQYSLCLQFSGRVPSQSCWLHCHGGAIACSLMGGTAVGFISPMLALYILRSTVRNHTPHVFTRWWNTWKIAPFLIN